MTSKDIDTTVNDVEQGTSFIEAGDRDKLLPVRELEGLGKQLRTIRESLKVAIAKRIDLEGRTEREEKKLNEIQDPTSWLTVSNQIVKSLSLSYKKFYFFLTWFNLSI